MVRADNESGSAGHGENGQWQGKGPPGEGRLVL